MSEPLAVIGRGKELTSLPSLVPFNERFAPGSTKNRYMNRPNPKSRKLSMEPKILILMTVLMFATLEGDNVKPGLAQMANDCPYQIDGASGRRVCEDTAIEFWKWVALETGPVTFDTRGSGRSLDVTVYTSNPYTEVVSALNEVRFTAQQGVEYTISAQFPAGQTGMIVMNWRTSSSDDGNDSPASADDFGSSVAISGGSGRSAGNNIDAGKEIGEPDHAGDSGGASVWWTWAAPATGAVTFDTRGSDFDTLLAVYTGEHLDRLAEVSSNDDASEGQRQSAVRFLAQQDQTYHIAVDGHDGRTGPVVLNWWPSPVSETFIASVEVIIPGPNGLMAVGRDITWIARAPEVDGLTKGWHHNRNSDGDLHGLQIHVDDTDIVVELWLNGARQAGASYRDGKPFGAFNVYANGKLGVLDGIQHYIYRDEKDWFFMTFRDGTLHGPFGEHVDGKPEGLFGAFSDDKLEGITHAIDRGGWYFEVYQDDTPHGPYGTYSADGLKNGYFGIYLNGRKEPGEVYWADGEREPGENRPPVPVPDNVPEEITFENVVQPLYLITNLFFWDPDGDSLDLTYFASSEPPGLIDTLPDGRLVTGTLSPHIFLSPGASGRVTVTACDPGDLCAEIVLNFLLQPEFTQMDTGDFSVEAPYCTDPLVNVIHPVTEVEVCARDLGYEDGDELSLKLTAQGNELLGHDLLILNFDPLNNSRSCKTVKVQGHIVDLQYQMVSGSKQISWWDWNTGQPLCQVGYAPDCFVGPRLFAHPGDEENRGELTIRSRLDSDSREWRWRMGRTGLVEGTIRVQAVALEPKECGAAVTDTVLGPRTDLEGLAGKPYWACASYIEDDIAFTGLRHPVAEKCNRSGRTDGCYTLCQWDSPEPGFRRLREISCEWAQDDNTWESASDWAEPACNGNTDHTEPLQVYRFPCEDRSRINWWTGKRETGCIKEQERRYGSIEYTYLVCGYLEGAECR